MSRTVFGKGKGEGQSLSNRAGQVSVFNHFTSKGDKPGVPLDWGYRPADRPMAEHLGRAFAADNRISGTSNALRIPENQPDYWRSKVGGVKKFSWEDC